MSVRTRVLSLIGLAATVAGVALAVGYVTGVREGGPLTGGNDQGVVLQLVPPGSRYSIGSLFLESTTGEVLTLETVTVLPGGGGLRPAGPVYVSGPERVRKLGYGGFLMRPGGPPADMPLVAPAGVAVGRGPHGSVEVVYSLVTPAAANSWIPGVEVTYRAGDRRYHKVFRAVVSVCTTAYRAPCPDHSSGT